MATCPKCLGPLTEHHQCPRGPLRRVVEAVSTLGIGAIGGVLLCFLIEERPAAALLVAAAALGAVLANAVRDAVARKP